MSRGVFRGATGRNVDRRTNFGCATNGNGRNALGVSGKGSSFSKKPKGGN